MHIVVAGGGPNGAVK